MFGDLHCTNKLRLNTNKKKSLVDFLFCIPSIVTQVTTRENIQHGFLSNRLIDSVYKRYPDFNVMLGTCRRLPTKSEYQLCVRSFPKLFDVADSQGHIIDDKFEALGFGRDIDSTGKETRHDTTITQESRQRAKCLTHNHQKMLRQERIALATAEANRKHLEAETKVIDKLELNNNVETKLKSIFGNTNLSHLTLFNFSSLTRNKLVGFVHVRKPDMKISQMPKKEKLEAAQNRGNNLIKMAFDIRDQPNMMREELQQETNNEE